MIFSIILCLSLREMLSRNEIAFLLGDLCQYPKLDLAVICCDDRGPLLLLNSFPAVPGQLLEVTAREPPGQSRWLKSARILPVTGLMCTGVNGH
jgi:hypothetical protein